MTPLTARLLTGTMLASSAAVAALAAGAGSAALAATACAAADPFQARTLTTTAAVANSRFGFPTVTGDFNGDGFTDAAVGAGGDKVGSVAAGTVSVYLGSAGGLGQPRVIIQGNVTGQTAAASDGFGGALAAGDFTGDGKDDLAIGAPGEASNTGNVALFLGTATGPATTGTVVTQDTAGTTVETGDRFGSALAAGDFNGDGRDDLAIGADEEGPAGSTVRSGEVSVLTGNPTGVQRGWIIRQDRLGQVAKAGDEFGVALAVGKVAGDARDDLVVGARGKDIGTDVDTGMIFILPNGTNTATGAPIIRGQGGSADENGDLYGSAMAVGDFNKDGVNDITVGAPGETYTGTTKRGIVQVLSGPVTKDTAGAWLQPSDVSDAAGANDSWGSVLAAGDVDRDSYADLLVGARGTTRGDATNAGAVFLYSGQRSGPLRPERSISQRDVRAADGTGDFFGGGAALGDFDNDGRTDAIIGAHGKVRDGAASAGAAYVLDDLSPATPRAVEQYAPTAAVQSAPVGTQVAPIRYAYVDNVGGPRLITQTNPENTGEVVRAADGPGEAVLTGRPAIAQTADGKGVVAARSVTGDLWVRTEVTAGGTAWGPWVHYGGPDLTGIAMTTLDTGRLGVFGIGARGELVVLEQLAGGRFGTWRSTGIGNLAGNPVTVALAGGIQVFARDTDGNVQTALYARSTLTGCATVGDRTVVGDPAVVVYPGSRLRVFATTADQQLITIGQDLAGAFEPTWSTVQGSGVAGAPAAVFDRVSARITVMARGTDRLIGGATETLQGSAVFGTWKVMSTTEAYTDVTAVPYVAAGGVDGFLFAFRDVNNRELFLTPSDDRSAARGAAPTFTVRSLPTS
jgi:hypothetical protein